MASQSSSVLLSWNPNIQITGLDNETKKYVSLSENFNKNSAKILKDLESHLQDKVFLVGDDLSAADVALAASMRDHVATLAKKKAKSKLYSNFPNVARWFDFVQYQIPEIISKPVDLLQAVPPSKKKKGCSKKGKKEKVAPKKEAAAPKEKKVAAPVEIEEKKAVAPVEEKKKETSKKSKKSI